MADDATASSTPTGEPQAQRIDQWLWFSRVLKSRTAAAQLISDGKVRVNRVRAVKPSQIVRSGDVLTIALRGKVRLIKVLAIGRRRGPPAEAQALYEALDAHASGTDPGAQPSLAVAKRLSGAGRPSKRDRRLIDRLTERD